LVTALFIVVSILGGGSQPASAQSRKLALDESATAKLLRFEGFRAMRYCEVFLIGADPATGGLRGNVFNTSELNGSNPLDSCPTDLWAKVNPESLKAEYGVLGVFKNGPRVWVNDVVELPVGEVGSIGGLEARWFMHVKLPKDFGKAGATYYKPTIGERASVMTFTKGQPVFILDDPDGMPWVMQAFTTLVDLSLTYDGLKTLDKKLKLPPGWKYRVKVLDQDLTIKAVDGKAWIVQDDLQGTYNACFEEGGQKACSYKP
jgi:hypothetical protein